MPSLLFVDCETTALGKNAAVIEIAAIPYIDGEYLEPFQSYIAPHPGATIDPNAFKVNKIDPKLINNFPPAHEVLRQFIEWLDKHERCFSIAGHNVKFDKEKIFTLFCKTMNYGNFVTRFRPTSVCTMALAKEVFHGKKNKPTGFSLGTLCKYFNIELDNAHSALPDIQATIVLYEELKKLHTTSAVTNSLLTFQQKRQKYMSLEYFSVNPEGDIFINAKAAQDSEAMQFILSEIYDLTVSDM